MSLIFVDGFDLGDSSTSGKWETFSAAIASSGGIHGSYADFTGTGSRCQKVFSADSHATFIASFYFREVTGGNDGSTATGIIEFKGDGGVTTHLTLTYLSDHSLRVRRGAGNGTILGTSAAGVLTSGAWHHIAFKAFLSDTVGTIDVWVDGVNVLSLTGQDTRNGGTAASFDSIELEGAAGGGSPHRIDDLAIFNGVDSGIAGLPNNDFPGVCRVESLVPDADTATEQWALSAGTDSFALVDETTPNGDTDYIEHDVSGEKTQLGLGALSTSLVNVLGIQLSSHARKTDAGTALFRQGIHSDASDANGADHALAETYVNYQDVIEADPDGGGSWTASQLNAAEVFVEVRV